VQILIKPLLQFCAALACGKQFDAEADFAECDDAGIEGAGVGRGEPPTYVVVRFAPAVELGENVGVEKKPS
jgi:hypothetical protein